jgi:hypothetical protein
MYSSSQEGTDFHIYTHRSYDSRVQHLSFSISLNPPSPHTSRLSERQGSACHTNHSFDHVRASQQRIRVWHTAWCQCAHRRCVCTITKIVVERVHVSAKSQRVNQFGSSFLSELTQHHRCTMKRSAQCSF